MALFVFVAHDVVAGGTRQMDARTVAFFGVHRNAAIYTLMQGVSLLACGGAQAVAAAACLFSAWRSPGARTNALSMFVAIGGGEGLVDGLKALFHRARPAAIYAPLGYSFPSGHSFFAVTLYGMAAYWMTRPTGDAPRRRWVGPVVVLLILLIGFSRVYLGVHYPSDVLAGFTVAIPWLWACLALSQVFRQLQRPGRQA